MTERQRKYIKQVVKDTKYLQNLILGLLSPVVELSLDSDLDFGHIELYVDPDQYYRFFRFKAIDEQFSHVHDFQIIYEQCYTSLEFKITYRTPPFIVHKTSISFGEIRSILRDDMQYHYIVLRLISYLNDYYNSKRN